MTTQDMQPVILLSPPTTQQPRRKKSFHKLTRKLSNFSLRSAITGDIPPLPDTNELLHPNHAMQSDLLPPSPCSSSSSVYSFNVSGIATPLSPSTSTSSRKSVDRLQEKYNNYKKGAVIGSGATAKLRLLEPVSGGPVVAIKTFRKKAKDETERGYDKRMTSEFCISKTLGHQHVIKVYDLLKDRKGRWCSVMEYCSGGDVFSILQQFDLSDAEMDCLFKQLLLGIAHIHASGVAHRDVKPENLVMTEKGVLKIADFGVADVVQSCFETEPNLCKGQCGSEPYWPPELFKIERHGNDDREGYDGRAVDIWGAAVTWHCVLYKTIPFFKASHEDPNWSEYLKVRRNRDWLPLSKCTKDEKDCLYGMFDPNPKTRWTAEQCLNSEWIKNVPVCYESNEKHAHHILSA